MPNVIRTECASCFQPVTIGVEREVLTSRIPSNGKRGSLYVAPHTVEAEITVNDESGLVLWDCPVCGYADSSYADPATRKALA